jgi:2-polyprenyl-3-methyl-5-hydroxy-6-metoxy-1,4-benzoquinol methylase
MPAYYANARHDVLATLPARRFERILEVGGGDFPTLLHLAEKSQAEAWGVDVRPTDAKLTKFLRGSITDPVIRDRLPTAQFDLILANDVIEHIEDTETFLATLRDLLTPGGVIAMSVPNARQIRLAFTVLVRGTFPRDDAGLFDRTHLRWFCRKDVERLASAAGLSVISHRGTGRLVPKALARTGLAELLALQNLFLFGK